LLNGRLAKKGRQSCRISAEKRVLFLGKVQNHREQARNKPAFADTFGLPTAF
jgi:hypothetical protein